MPGQPDPLSDVGEPLQPYSVFKVARLGDSFLGYSILPQFLSLLLQFWDENGCKGYALIRVNLIFSFFL